MTLLFSQKILLDEGLTFIPVLLVKIKGKNNLTMKFDKCSDLLKNTIFRRYYGCTAEQVQQLYLAINPGARCSHMEILLVLFYYNVISPNEIDDEFCPDDVVDDDKKLTSFVYKSMQLVPKLCGINVTNFAVPHPKNRLLHLVNNELSQVVTVGGFNAFWYTTKFPNGFEVSFEMNLFTACFDFDDEMLSIVGPHEYSEHGRNTVSSTVSNMPHLKECVEFVAISKIKLG